MRPALQLAWTGDERERQGVAKTHIADADDRIRLPCHAPT
jgi:hypothetical protein